MSNFGNRLKELRLKKELTQEELGKILGKSKNNISQYERNARQADDETKKQLAQLFNVSLDYLLGFTNDPTPIGQPRKEKEIDEELNGFIEKLKSTDGLMFSGEPLDDHTRKLLLKTIQNVKELAEDMKRSKP